LPEKLHGLDSLCPCPYFHRSATYIVKKESQKADQSFSELLLYGTLKIPYGKKMPDLPHAMFQVQQLKLIRNFYLPANAGALSPQGDGERLQSEVVSKKSVCTTFGTHTPTCLSS